MEANVKKWGLVSVVLAVLVIALVAYRMLAKAPGSEEDEILSVNGGFKKYGATISQNGVNNIPGNVNTTSRSGDIASLQRQVDTLTQQMSELIQAVGDSGVSNANGSRPETALQEFQAAANDPEMRRKFQQFQIDLSEKKHELVTQTFQQEIVDDTWAIESEDSIKTNFYRNDALSGSDLVSIDCRTSMCRMTISMPEVEIRNSDDAANQFVIENELLASISRDMPELSMRSIPGDNGGLKYEVFLYREGFQRPDLQNPLAGKSMSDMIEYVERY